MSKKTNNNDAADNDAADNDAVDRDAVNKDTAFQVFLFQWAARGSAVAFEMVIPALIGIGLDRFFGTVALFTILGVICGMALAFWQLYKFTEL